MRTNDEIKSLFIGTFETELGQRLIEYLTEVFVDRAIYQKGQTFEEAAFREGQRDIVLQIKKQLKVK